MKIKFLGHAAFLLTSGKGIAVITDPYKTNCFGGAIKYYPITEKADIVTISHDHDDHNETRIAGNPVFVREIEQKEIQGITIMGIKVFHDQSSGKERGANIIFNILIDDMNIVHLGDLGHSLSSAEAEKIGNVDVLLVPVGGYFTIDVRDAEKVIEILKPKIVIPMHFKTSKCDFPIAPVEDFIQNKEVRRIDGEIDLKKQELPPKTSIYYMKPSK